MMTEIINFACNKCCLSCENDKKKCIALKLRKRAVNRSKYQARKAYNQKLVFRWLVAIAVIRNKRIIDRS